MKRIVIAVLVLTFTFILGGCSISPVYHSKSEVDDFAKTVFGENVKYISVNKQRSEHYDQYVYEDEKGQQFTITSYAYQTNLDGATMPGYYKAIRESYQYDIYMNHKEELDAVLDEMTDNTGLFIYNYDYHENTNNAFIKESPVDITIGTKASGKELEEVLKIYAKYYVKMDEILSYNCDFIAGRNMENIRYNDHVFNSSIDLKLFDERDKFVEITRADFSCSDEERWDEATLYNHLYEQIAPEFFQ